MKLALYYSQTEIEAGCDEAGRGCLAGPVFAAAVILDPSKPIAALNDSKKLNAKQRDKLRKEIEEKSLSWSVAQVSHTEIDEINILNASFLAMHRAVDTLKTTPSLLLIDGNRFNKHKKIPNICIIKGDAKYQSIAAASILAKTYRDEYMANLAIQYPVYEWESNKGYPTKKHRAAIQKHGACTHHRKSFSLLPKPPLKPKKKTPK